MKQDMILILDLGSEENPRLAVRSVHWAFTARSIPTTSPPKSLPLCRM